MRRRLNDNLVPHSVPGINKIGGADGRENRRTGAPGIAEHTAGDDRRSGGYAPRVLSDNAVGAGS